jgi:hypothetical protein
MEVLQVKCQIRRDLRGPDIPRAVLRQDSLRSAIAGLIGKSIADLSTQSKEQVLASVVKGIPEDLESWRERLRDRITVANGYFQADISGRRGGFIVEDLSVDEDTVYMCGLAPTHDCGVVVTRTQEILIQHGVSKATFDESEDSYATETIARLDGPIEALFSDSFCIFANTDVPTAAHQGARTRVVVHPFMIRLKVNSWQTDAATPHQAAPDRWDLEIAHESFGDHDKQVYKLYTRFEFSKHMELLNRLNQYLSAKSQGQ